MEKTDMWYDGFFFFGGGGYDLLLPRQAQNGLGSFTGLEKARTLGGDPHVGLVATLSNIYIIIQQIHQFPATVTWQV